MENVDTVDLYNLVRGQVLLTPMGDVIDINQAAVIEVMKLLKPDNPKDTFLSVVKCFEIEMELLNRGKSNELHDGVN